MFRPVFCLTLLALLVSILGGCIVVDKHHGRHLPPGQMKKHKY